jgi:ubiquinone/menaquinone biosynthesis C-methylase UbiE
MPKDKILYQEMGSTYNRTRKADPYLTNRLFDLIAAKENDLCFDIGCGTGNYTIQLANRGINIWGIDPSEEMLRKAKEKLSSVKWLVGSAERIPISNIFFNGGIAILTVHHWTSLENAFLELFRVFKPGGRFIIFTSTPEQMNGYWLNHYFPEMMAESIKKMPALNDIEKSAKNAGFKIYGTEKYSVQIDLQDHFLYAGKLNPTLYFDEHIRNGISSFISLSNRIEVQDGLQKVKSDILTKGFEIVKSKYENNLGDYLFIMLEKKM